MQQENNLKRLPFFWSRSARLWIQRAACWWQTWTPNANVKFVRNNDPRCMHSMWHAQACYTRVLCLRFIIVKLWVSDLHRRHPTLLTAAFRWLCVSVVYPTHACGMHTRDEVNFSNKVSLIVLYCKLSIDLWAFIVFAIKLRDELIKEPLKTLRMRSVRRCLQRTSSSMHWSICIVIYRKTKNKQKVRGREIDNSCTALQRRQHAASCDKIRTSDNNH